MKTININKKIICPECKGEGTIKAGNLREMHNHDIETCPVCLGPGMIRLIGTITYTRI